MSTVNHSKSNLWRVSIVPVCDPTAMQHLLVSALTITEAINAVRRAHPNYEVEEIKRERVLTSVIQVVP